MRTLKTLTIAAAALTVGPTIGAGAASERLLVQDADLIVVTDQSLPCGQPAEVTVRSSDPDLFRRDSARMQTLVDGVRAILGFECTRLPALNITGETGAPRSVVYTATAGDQTRWLVRESRAIDDGAGTQPSRTSAVQAPPQFDVSDVSVAALRTGMSVEAAMNAATAEFSSRPAYWADTGVIIAGTAGCEKVMIDGASPAIGQRCLIARLTDGPEPKVYQVVLRQSVDQDQRQSITDELVRRFGEPRRVSRGTASDAAGWIAAPEFAHYAWRAPLDMVVDGDGHPAHLGTARHAVESYVLAGSAKTELTIWVTDPGEVGAGAPRHSVRF